MGSTRDELRVRESGASEARLISQRSTFALGFFEGIEGSKRILNSGSFVSAVGLETF